VVVLPIRNQDRDWGLLAVAAPVDSPFLDQGITYEWDSLFCEALAYEDLWRSLRDSEERYALAARATNDALWDWDPPAGKVYYSPRWAEMLGRAEGAVGDSPEDWTGRVHPEDRPGLLEELEALRRGGKTSITYEHRALTAGGGCAWLLCRGLAVPGGGAPATRVVGSFSDVTERRSLEERLRHQALYDSLTGLPNRALFLDRLSQVLATAERRPGYCYAVVWLDLDNFKDLNDTMGHLVGDELLVQVAERLRSHLREADTAARFGGDEFAVLLAGVEGTSEVLGVLRRVSQQLEQPYELGGHRFVVTASIGVATGATGYHTPDEVLREADAAMYRAKSARRLATGHR
jgi:diguanylate cyclase (GGDEF)-like protein/PAS domain S-box-containing protein